MKITGKFLESLAYFYTNTNRWDLEQVGIIPAGKSGDKAWERFNHNFDIFILKLSDEQQNALAGLAMRYIGEGA